MVNQKKTLRLIYKLTIIVTVFISGLLPNTSFGQAIPVTVKQTESGYSLYRNGKPYLIKGAGGQGHLKTLASLGGNSIRTWGMEEAEEALANAEKYGFTVMVGMWVQHERHGFDYNDEAAVKKQLEDFRAFVMKYKDHPAVLLWGIGNEVDLFYSNTKVWDAIQDIAAMIHEVDPHHPTTTVTAGLDSTEVQLIKSKAPDIDIYGINTYGDIAQVSQNLKRFGWDGPYIISEWGPNGHWEVPKTPWGAPIEQTSTEKAASYGNRYTKYIAAQNYYCIGSYVFLWGQKQETTSTWYGLFTESGNPTEPLDQLHHAWQKEPLANSSPSIDSFYIEGFKDSINIKVKAGTKQFARLASSDPDDKNLHVEWLIFPETSNAKAGGDFESSLQPVLGKFRKRNDTQATFKVPAKEGPYRLFVFVTDRGNKTAYANIPFYVQPRTALDEPASPVRLKTQTISETGELN